MKKQFKILSVAAGITLALTGTAALAEQTIGVQTVAATPAVATAKVNVRVIVPKIVILRVGVADGTISDVDFTVGLSPAVTGAPGNSLAYTGGIPPTLASTVATTNPTTTAGALTVGAWTNGASGATLTCALSALTGATAFANGATAGGVPGTTDITVTSVAGAANLQHPGTTLTACAALSAANTAIPRLTPLGGTFTYALAATNLASMATGTYGNVVTYTATAP